MSLYQIAANLYARLHRVPLLGRLLDWVKPLALYLIPSLRQPNTTSTLSGDLRRELESQRRLIESLGHALEGQHGWSREQSLTTDALTDRIEAIEARLNQDAEALVARLQTLEGHLTGVSGGEGIWPRLERLDTGLRQAAERTEWVRAEILYELRHLTRHGSSEAVAPAPARILAPEKLAAAQPHPRLNLGCGHILDPERLNVDGRELPGIDIVADVGDLPFESGALAEIYAAHLVEHFTELDLRRRLLPYWRGLLRPDGELRLVVPDAEAMLAAHQRGEIPFEDLRLVTFGGQEYDGDFHYTMFSPASLEALLRAGGFSRVETLARARPNGRCLEMELLARP